MMSAFLLLSAAACRNETDDGSAGWKLVPPDPAAMPVLAHEIMPGNYPVGSRIADKEALGGFGPCDNFPMRLGKNAWGAKGAVSVVAFPEEAVAYFQHQGFAVRIVNRTNKNVAFRATDSRLSLVREAKDADGAWQAIESLPTTHCGNSHHRVFLEPNQYWQFPARLYTGPVKTKLRFRLDRHDGEPPLYSAEFDGAIAIDQLPNANNVPDDD
jgi:hypothetical protein